MSVSEFIEYWVTLNEENKRVYHSVSGDYSDTTNHYDGKLLLYLKDWHFVKVCVLKLTSHAFLHSLVFLYPLPFALLFLSWGRE